MLNTLHRLKLEYGKELECGGEPVAISGCSSVVSALVTQASDLVSNPGGFLTFRVSIQHPYPL
jgi:hypothetical protein